MIVVDASALLHSLLRTPVANAIDALLLDSGRTLHAPHLIDVEAAQVIRRYAAAREIEPERGREALANLAAFPLQRYPHGDLLPRIWELRDNFTVYDAAYVALAEMLDAALLTRDARLTEAARKHTRIALV